MNCAKCNQPITPASTASVFRSKSYHPACLAALKTSAKRKDASHSAKINDPDLERLTAYVCKLFSISDLTPLLRKQIEDFRTSQGYSYGNILLTVRYFFELSSAEAPNPSVSPTLGIVPYVYQEALDYFAVVKEAQEANQVCTFQERTVTVPFVSKPASIPCSYHMEDL